MSIRYLEQQRQEDMGRHDRARTQGKWRFKTKKEVGFLLDY